MFDFFSDFSNIYSFGNWNIFSLDIKSTYWEARLVFTVELTNNACFLCDIPWVLDTEEEGLVLLIAEQVSLLS